MTELIAVVTFTLLAVISPGPDFAMVTRNSLTLSRRAGVLTALGIGLGVLVHLTYTLLGVGLLIEQSLWLFNAIKLVGAAYLIYLGVTMLRTKPGVAPADGAAPPASDWSALRTGFLTNALIRRPRYSSSACLSKWYIPIRHWRCRSAMAPSSRWPTWSGSAWSRCAFQPAPCASASWPCAIG